MNIQTKTVETIKLKVDVIQRDIDDGICGSTSRCMEKVSIERALRNVGIRGRDDDSGGPH